MEFDKRNRKRLQIISIKIQGVAKLSCLAKLNNTWIGNGISDTFTSDRGGCIKRFLFSNITLSEISPVFWIEWNVIYISLFYSKNPVIVMVKLTVSARKTSGIHLQTILVILIWNL